MKRVRECRGVLFTEALTDLTLTSPSVASSEVASTAHCRSALSTWFCKAGQVHVSDGVGDGNATTQLTHVVQEKVTSGWEDEVWLPLGPARVELAASPVLPPVGRGPGPVGPVNTLYWTHPRCTICSSGPQTSLHPLSRQGFGLVTHGARLERGSGVGVVVGFAAGLLRFFVSVLGLSEADSTLCQGSPPSVNHVFYHDLVLFLFSTGFHLKAWLWFSGERKVWDGCLVSASSGCRALWPSGFLTGSLLLVWGLLGRSSAGNADSSTCILFAMYTHIQNICTSQI